MGNTVSFLINNIICTGCKAFLRWTKWITSYFFITFRKKSIRKYRYDMKVDYNPFKVGFFIPSQEWDLECFSENQEVDEMFCFGVNSSGECLTLQIFRDTVSDNASSLFLKVNGCAYSLPTELKCLKTEERSTFGSSRFYMQCLSPFRKWKIFFNGMLRETSLERAHDRVIHVRFSFIWVASSGVFDFTSDYSASSMADILSETEWDTWTPPIDRLLRVLNEYHQPGMLHGTVQIEENPEQNVILWGSRHHSYGINEEEDEFLRIDIFGNTENGILFCFKILSVEKFLKRNLCGFIMLPNGSLKVARFVSLKKVKRQKRIVLSFKIKAGEQLYNISAFFYGHGRYFGKGIGENLSLSEIDVIINGVWGSGISIKRLSVKGSCHKVMCKQLKTYMPRHAGLEHLVVTFEDPVCLNKSLTGNLGSALAKLVHLRDEISLFDVPKGLVITTLGYEEFSVAIKQAIYILKENVPKYTADELIPLCDRIVEEVSSSFFPADVYDSLCQKLNEILDDCENSTFCIFPSVAGTDSAVQLLEAYLEHFPCVTGLSEITKSIKKCWASQFSYGAVICKRSTGQTINKQMAVIVQKVTPYKISGIISTCDLSSGNPSVMQIREESDELSKGVVRVIQLRRDLKNHLKVLHTVMLDHDSVSDEVKESTPGHFFDERNFLSKEQAIFLGRMAVKVEKEFQYPSCIEWGFKKNKFFILQVRPIICINAESNYEILHYCDSYIRTEDEWFTIFSTGEAFLGAVSPLGMDVLNCCIEMLLTNLEIYNPEFVAFSAVPYFPKFLLCSCRHLMYCLGDGILCFQMLSESLFLKTISFVMNCRVGEEQVLQELISQRHGNFSWSYKWIFRCIMVAFFSGKGCKFLEERIGAYELDLEDANSAIEVLNIISYHYQDMNEPFNCYMNCTFAATVWSMIVIYILSKIRKDGLDNIHKDFNFVMCACSDSQEGDIPLDILVLSRRIAQNIEPDLFKAMAIEDAKIWLEDSEIDKKVHFSDFMAKHGHRSYKEMDIFQSCWTMNPSTVIKVLQILVPSLPKDLISFPTSVECMFSQLPIAPSWFQKILLKYAVPKCIKSLREAKRAKSNLLKIASVWRQAFHHLADTAVKEFHIPFPEVLFFLSLDDIRRLLRTSSSHLVIKALKCWEIHSEIDKYVFPIITIGSPLPLTEHYYDDKRLKINSVLKGCPISRGTVVGTAVVAMKPDDIKYVEKGAILITRSPSIAWSLFFPILGGFATDLGGLLSDGAVCARDYGLPCVINLIRASQTLETGDRVFLDGNTGVLRRISID